MAVLVYTDAADGVERSINVTAEPILIGRNPECTIRSTDGRVSRMHARLYCDHTGTTYIEDLGSSNGVYVGQNKVMHSAIPLGELVLVGSLTMRVFDGTGQVAAPPQQQQGYYDQQAYAQQGYGQQGGYGQQPGYAPPSSPATPPHGVPSAPATPPHGVPRFSGDAYTAPASPIPQAPDPYGYQQPAAMPPPQAPPAMPPPQAAPPAMPPPQAQPAPAAGGDTAAIAHLLEVERKSRMAAEEERDAYGARMAELHGELRGMREQLQQAQQQVQLAQQQAQQAQARPAAPAVPPHVEQELRTLRQTVEQTQAALKQAQNAKPVNPPHIETLALELESYRVKLVDATEQLASAEARLKSAEDELSVARSDVMAAEDRIISEVAAAESRAATELQSRVEELEVTRTDLIKSEERVLEMSRKIGELQERLARLGVEE